MPHYICRWSSGNVLFASVSGRDELDAILEDKGEAGSCRVARYNGPVAFELTPKLPGVARCSSKRFKVPEPQGLLMPAWEDRSQFSDVKALAADGSSEPAHKVLLRSRCPVLHNLTDSIQNVRFQVIPNREVLQAFLEFVYTDDVQQHRVTHHLHMAAIQCRMPRLVALCEARLAQRIEQEVAAWGGYSGQQQQSCADFVLDWIRYCERLQRQDLKDFCCHLISRHQAVAAARPTWPKLQPATQQLIAAVAAAAVQPVVERQVVSGCGAAAVRLESDLYARAGGRLNESEWQQLQRYRSGCQSAAAQLPASCPLVMSQQEMYDCGLTMDEPALTYELQTSDMEVQKGILGAITKFAFPTINRSLNQLRQAREECSQAPGQQRSGLTAGMLSAAAGAALAAVAAAAAAEEEDWDHAESRQSNQPSCSQLCAAAQEVEQPPHSSCSSLPAPLQQQQQPAKQRDRHRLHRQTYPHDSAHSECNNLPEQRQLAAMPPLPAKAGGAPAQQPAPAPVGPASSSCSASASQREAAAILRLQQSLVQDMLQYDESAPLKDSLARLLVAAEAGCSEAAAKLVSGDVSGWEDPTSDESCSEALGAGGCGAAAAAAFCLVEEAPFHAGRATPSSHAGCQPAFGHAADELHFDDDDLHPSADCDLLLHCGPPDMTSQQSACAAAAAAVAVGQKRRHVDTVCA